MNKDSIPAHLVLEDGSTYQGYAFGHTETSTFGEVVFNTSMTGYQEILTDPSYAGQIVVPTYPLIGNYGINRRDFESRRIQLSGFAVRDHCDAPSHPDGEMTLDEFLQTQGVLGISGIDTRAVTRKIRDHGVMMGVISVDEPPQLTLERLKDLPSYDDTDFVSRVTTASPYGWDQPVPGTTPSDAGYRVLVTDMGLKYNILRLLRTKGCEVIAFPASASAQELLERQPDGILMSPGPGDPALLDHIVNTARGIIGRIPIMGICLGNQILARAFGGRTYKLKFGHRGGNHPVRDLETGRVHITAQNHGYAVDPDSLPSDVEVSHISLNDNTVEGLRHRGLSVMSIQYHSEASPGPRDNEYLFDRFLSLIREAKH